jgi:Tol biopolymer transport system component
VRFLSLVAILALSDARATAIEVGAPGHTYNPTWSIDGKWIAFELDPYEGSVDLYVVPVDGTRATAEPKKISLPGSNSAFSTQSSIAASPSWHPGGQLVFEGSNAGGTMRLYYWAADRPQAVELLSAAKVAGDLSWPTVSADGKKVAFVSDATGNGDLYVWTQATNQVTALINSTFSEMAPRFDRTSNRIGYSRKNLGGEDLFVWDAPPGGSSPGSSAWVGGNGDQTRPVWAGENIVYFTNERGAEHWDIAVASGPKSKRIVARDVRLPLRASPALSPDGKWVAFGVEDPKRSDRIVLAALDGSRVVDVPTDLVACGEPAIANSGDKLVLAYTALPHQGADWRQLQLVDVTAYVR